MHAAQSRAETLTRSHAGMNTDVLMPAVRAILVLIGVVLVERAYLRAGG